MSDVRELPGAQWAARGTRLLAGAYVWLTLWLAAWVLLPALVLPWSPVVVSSGSMGPVINRGDIVLSTASGTDALSPGQVITFRRAGTDGDLVTHRIQSIDGAGLLTTRGDANQDDDSGRVRPEAVVGRARLLVPYAGLPMMWLRESPLLFLAWVVLTAVAFALARAGVPAIDQLVDVDGERLFRPAEGIWRPVDRVLGFVEGAPRPPPGPFRAWAPTVGTGLSVAAFVRTPMQAVAAVVLTILVLVADPRGPHVPVGRGRVGLSNLRQRLTDRMLPRIREQGASVLLPFAVAGAVALGLAPGSEAVFVDAVADTGNSVGTGTWDCAGLGEVVLQATGDAGIRSDLPGDHAGGSGGLVLDQTTGQEVLVGFGPVDVPDSCTIAAVDLEVSVAAAGDSDLGAARLATGFDAGTVTAGTRPAAVLTGSSTVPVQPGLVALDVTDLVTGGPTNLLLLLDPMRDVVPVVIGSMESGSPAVLRVRFGDGP